MIASHVDGHHCVYTVGQVGGLHGVTAAGFDGEIGSVHVGVHVEGARLRFSNPDGDGLLRRIVRFVVVARAGVVFASVDVVRQVFVVQPPNVFDGDHHHFGDLALEQDSGVQSACLFVVVLVDTSTGCQCHHDTSVHVVGQVAGFHLVPASGLDLELDFVHVADGIEGMFLCLPYSNGAGGDVIHLVDVAGDGRAGRRGRWRSGLDFLKSQAIGTIRAVLEDVVAQRSGGHAAGAGSELDL